MPVLAPQGRPLTEYLSRLGSKALYSGWGGRLADWVDDKVNTAKGFYEQKAIASGHPLVAGATSFGTGVVGDVIKGTADLLRLGGDGYNAYRQYKEGDYAGALSSAAQDAGRLGGIILIATGPKGVTEVKANRLLRDIEAERARGGYGFRRSYQGSVEPRAAKVVSRAGEKFVGRDSRPISKTSGSVSKLNDRVYRGPTTKQGGHIHAGQRVANFTYKGKGVKLKPNGETSTHELANIHVPIK